MKQGFSIVLTVLLYMALTALCCAAVAAAVKLLVFVIVS